MRGPKWLPDALWRIIFYEYCPTPLLQYIKTNLNNHYAKSFQVYVYPSNSFTSLLRCDCLPTLIYFWLRLNYYDLPQKKYLSRRHMTVISYEDFPIFEQNIMSQKYTTFFKPIKCLNPRILH